MVFLCYSILVSFTSVVLDIYVLMGLRTIKQVASLPLLDKEPSLAIIIAVRNEEEDIEKALQSVCNINYKNYRIIVINDRSTDGTGAILKRFEAKYPKLTVNTIATLPDGWLGKNNALYQGYKSSDEEWILFIDADIVFHPDAINKAVGFAVAEKLDHLTVLPEVHSPSEVLNSFLATFGYMLMLHMRPWLAKDSKSKSFAAIGAFNLLRRTAYEKAGTHEKIKIRPDDDLQLGMMMKHAGFRQDVLAGSKNISLEWYKNLKQFGNGLLKNSFSVDNYQLTSALAKVVVVLFFLTVPIPLMAIFGSFTIRFMASVMFVFQAVYMSLIIPGKPGKWWYALVIPFASFYIAYIITKAAILTIKQGGIYWRDSFYSLKMLRGK